jgi:hypothetical protein
MIPYCHLPMQKYARILAYIMRLSRVQDDVSPTGSTACQQIELAAAYRLPGGKLLRLYPSAPHLINSTLANYFLSRPSFLLAATYILMRDNCFPEVSPRETDTVYDLRLPTACPRVLLAYDFLQSQARIPNP